MKKRMLSSALLLLLMFAEYVPVVLAHPPNSTNVELLVLDTIHEPGSLDPAWAYDIGSHEVIMNVYEPLLFFDCDYTLGPYAAGKVDQFVPKLATSWTEQSISETSPEGLTWKKRWTFIIRTGVRFHDGNLLTPEDVEYSFERLLVQDRLGGPAWMLYEPLLGVYRAVDPATDSNWGLKIDHAVESDAASIWFNLVSEFPSLTFKQILSQTWSSVVKKTWCVAEGDFDGNWAAGWETIYNMWHDPSVSFINSDMMGTGPYKFSYWIGGDSWSIVKFDAYWDGWSARVSPGSDQRIGGYITTVTWYYIALWSTRKARLAAGDSDLAYVDRQYRDQLLGWERIRCYYLWNAPQPPPDSGYSLGDFSTSDITYEFPLLALDAFFFTFNIDETTFYAGGPGGHGYPSGTFAEDGIPRDLFSDINVRLGFAYAFDYTNWFDAMYLSEGELPSDPVIKGLPYDNPAQERYSQSIETAKYYLRLAWGGIDNNPPGGRNPNLVTPGALWKKGMTFSIVHPAGNTAAGQAATILADSINSLRPKFHIDYEQAMYGPIFVPSMVSGQLPLFVTGWHGDCPDPHYFVYTFMHSQGFFTMSQRYSNPYTDVLIEEGIATPDGPAREAIYYELQALYHGDVPSAPLVQPVGREFERDWMRGWYYNPVYQGHYVYHLWKAKTHFGDANNDGAVNVVDMGVVSAHWTGVGPYNTNADLSGGKGGTTGSDEGYFRGIPDGKVNVVDAAIVSAYWDTMPTGPSHP